MKLLSMYSIIWIFLLSFYQENVNGLTGFYRKTESNLVKHLLRNYSKDTKPSYSVEVKFALNLNQIVTLIEREQILVINVYLDHEWFDQRLKWNPSEFDNISLIRINSERIWA